MGCAYSSHDIKTEKNNEIEENRELNTFEEVLNNKGEIIIIILILIILL